MYIYYLEKRGVPFYVGRTGSLNERLTDHKRKFGNKINIVVIQECDYSDSMQLETKYIIEYSKKFKLKNKNTGEAHQQLKIKRLKQFTGQIYR